MTFRNPLIIWDHHGQKWMDPGNDFWCHERPDGGWRVTARYGFTEESSGPDDRDFPQQHQAMEFYVNYLHERREKLTVAGYERKIGTLIRRAAAPRQDEAGMIA